MDEKIDTLLKEGRVIQPTAKTKAAAHIQDYEQAYQASIADPEAFWGGVAKELDWFSPWSKVLDWNYPWAKWFVGATCNIAYNCLDRHANTWRRNKVAIIWVGENGEERIFTYGELLRQVNRCANALKALGLQKGDRVTIYLPKIPEQVVAMLACARIGVIHSVVYSGFSAPALASRIQDAEARVVITADVGYDRGKTINLKGVVDDAVRTCPSVEKVVVVRRESPGVALAAPKEIDWVEWLQAQSAVCQAEALDAETPLYILYTSGTTGKPKGVVHVHGGYMVGTYITTKYVFDLKEEDVYFCVADPGWVTGHSYIVYAPLVLGATSFIYEGAPTHPNPDRWWSMIEKYQITILYTAPTAIRGLMRFGESWPDLHDLSSLRLLGTVGEPINPEAWMWYHTMIGKEKCPIVDTWWQTETGAAMITPLPGATDLKPGSATLPMFGVVPQIVDGEGQVIEGAAEGNLCIAQSWPGQARTVWGDHDRFFQTYFTTYRGKYFTGDGCRRDEDGYYWITGRIDDVINVSGCLLYTAEIESALVAHQKVAEAAVVGAPHDIKGQGIYAFVTCNAEVEPDEALRKELIAWVRHEIGPIATPDVIQFAPGLPKTR
ncbi:MAG TPA: acetate--CoA ligase, partial [Nitrospira sp.]|nr:acetate--CoA ligase [Nitrospira sp.]